MTEDLSVNPGIQPKRINVGEKRFQEVATQAFLLAFLKPEAVGEIILRRRQDGDFHVSLS
jgi:hypothetical protein